MDHQSPANSTLRALTREDIPRVAEIHVTALPEDFCSRLGSGFLTDIFYPHFLECDGAIGLVAGEGRVDGFVVGAPARGYYANLARRHPGGLLRAVIGAVMRRPAQVLYFLEVFRVLFQPGGFRPGAGDAELLYIAVDPARQGRSLGSVLASGLLARLSGTPYDRCVVKTLASTPDTIRFYERLGFSVVIQERGRVWLAHPLPAVSHEPEPVSDV